jgi:hypothetical protein
MSNSARPEIESYRELEALVRHLGDELAGYRRRALAAEERLRGIEGGQPPEPPHLRERLAELEGENAALRGRLEAATSRTRSMLDRVHFLRQQVETERR